jgi:hypothetical protein
MNHPDTGRGIRKGLVLALAVAVLLPLGAIYYLQSRPARPASAVASEPTPAPPVQAARMVPAARPVVHAVKIPTATLEDKLGLQVASVRLTAAGRALDVRYRVVDQNKAASLDTRENMAYIVDQASGTQIGASQPPPPLELNKPTDGRVYYAMFPNTGGALKPGSKITLVIGQAHARDLTVE